MKHYLFLAVFFLIVSCNSDTLKKEVELYRNGKTKRMYYLDKEGNRQGKAVLYYENGKIEDVIYFKDDLLDGNFYSYDENGVLRNKGKYKSDIQIDTSYFFNERGQLESYTILNEQSEKIKDAFFHANGKLKEVRTFFIGTGQINAFKSYTDKGELLQQHQLSKFLTIDKTGDSLSFNLYGKWTENPDSIVLNVVKNFDDYTDDSFPRILRSINYLKEPLKFKIMDSDYVDNQLFLYIQVYGMEGKIIHYQPFHVQLKKGGEIPKDNLFPMQLK